MWIATPRNGDGLTALADRLPRTPTAETGGGGWHFYFRLLPGEALAKVPSLLPGIDLQGDGSYVIAPPSIHPSGRPYHWLQGRALGEVLLAPLPLLIRQLVALHRHHDEEPRRRPAGSAASVLTLAAALSMLRGARRCGGGWVALCPAHDDREQSLSLAEGAGGKLLAYCHAGCAFTEILAALRREAA